MDPRWIEPLMYVGLILFFGLILCLVAKGLDDDDKPRRGGGFGDG